MRPITVAGGGLVGCLIAKLLAQRGLRAQVLEARKDPRLHPEDGLRSINLALSDRGWRALRLAGLEERVRTLALPMSGRFIHHEAGHTYRLPYGRDGQAIHSVSRFGLWQLLVESLDEEPLAQIRFETTWSADHDPTHPLIGADGAGSMVREWVEGKTKTPNHWHTLDYGYKELPMPPTSTGDFAMPPDALHIWPREKRMLIGLPNPDKTFTCTLFLPYVGDGSFAELSDSTRVEAFFAKEYPDALPLFPTLRTDFQQHPTGRLGWLVAERFAHGSAVLLGDAAHAIVPFYGQGMNAGFEDARLLVEALVKEGSWQRAVERFSAERPKDALAIAQLAMENFVEMRDSVADAEFLARRAWSDWLSREFPERWLSPYQQVTFSHLPYSEALARGTDQKQLLDGWVAQDITPPENEKGLSPDQRKALEAVLF